MINRDVVQAQVEGGMGFALCAAMNEAVTFIDGKVDQSNFHTYTPLRNSNMPRVEVHIVPSAAAPTRIGEPPLPPLTPAAFSEEMKHTSPALILDQGRISPFGAARTCATRA